MPNVSIFNFNSPLEIHEEGSTVTIKGFASVSEMDRTNEIVADPREFNIPRFMTSPTLMVNHKFINDEYGNARSAGKVTLAVAVRIKSITEDEVIVQGLDNPEFTDSVCRACAPELEVGDLGLFIHAEVTSPVAKEMVLSGEVGGLSWRGYTRKRERAVCEGGTACVSLKNIDLMEISLVHNQCQPQSTFMIAKSVDGEVSLTKADLSSLSTYAIRFSKATFPTPDYVETYMAEHSLSSKSIEEDAQSYVAYLASPSAMETEKSVSISIGGVELISAPDKNQDELIGLHVGNLTTNPVKENPMASQKNLRVFLLDEKGLADRFPGLATQSMKTVATAEGEAIEIYTMEFPEVDESTDTSVDSIETPVVSDVVTEIVAEVSTEVVPADSTKPNGEDVASLRAQFDALKAQLNALGASIIVTPVVLEKEVEVVADAVTETPEPVAVEAAVEVTAEVPAETAPIVEATQVVVEKSTDPVLAQLQLLTDTMKSISAENAKLRETTVALQTRLDSQTPSHDPREEDFMVQKSASEVSPRDLVGGFAGRTFFTSTR